MFGSKTFDPQTVPPAMRDVAAELNEAMLAASELISVHCGPAQVKNEPIAVIQLAQLLLARKDRVRA